MWSVKRFVNFIDVQRAAQAWRGKQNGRNSLVPLWLEQALKFFTVGVLNTVLDAGLYFMLTRWLGFSQRRVLAKGLSYGVGVLNSFYWNRSWTFGAQDDTTWATFGAFVLSNLAALGLNAGAMHLGLELFHWPELLTLGWATGVTFVWNFGLNKFFIFRTRRSSNV